MANSSSEVGASKGGAASVKPLAAASSTQGGCSVGKSALPCGGGASGSGALLATSRLCSRSSRHLLVGQINKAVSARQKQLHQEQQRKKWREEREHK
ncbi:MAG: hypothetical protein AAFQ37_06305, partial [Bacteroidota bacterium]